MCGDFGQRHFKLRPYILKFTDILCGGCKAPNFVSALLVHSAVFRRQKYNRLICLCGFRLGKAKLLNTGERLALCLSLFEKLYYTSGVFIRVCFSFFKRFLKGFGVLDFGLYIVDLIRAGIAYALCGFSLIHRPGYGLRVRKLWEIRLIPLPQLLKG